MNPENAGRNQDGTFAKGYSGNPDGKPAGTLSFKSKWLIFIDKIAKQNGITSDDVDEQLLAVAFKQMKSGDFRYWKDIQDRVYGTALNNIELGGNLIVNIPKEVADSFGINATDIKTSRGDTEQEPI